MILSSRSQALCIATWPGSESDTNQLISILRTGFASSGVELVDILSLSHEPPQDLVALLIHWPEDVFWTTRGPLQFLRLWKWFYALSRWRRRGVPIVWIVHNLQPHPAERTPTWNWFIRMLCSNVDGFLSLSPSTVDEIKRDLPGTCGKPIDFFLHPRYPKPSYPCDSRSIVRAELGVPNDAYLVAQIGFIAAYKGVETLIRAVRSSPRSDLYLLIAGQLTVGGYLNIGPRPDGQRFDSCEGFLETLRHAIGDDPRIRLCIGWLSPDRLAALTVAVDLVVLPFQGHLHSGSMIYTLSAGCPVLTTPQPFSLDICDLVGSEWVRLYNGVLTSDVIDAALAIKPVSPAPKLDQFDPAFAAKRIISFVQQLSR